MSRIAKKTPSACTDLPLNSPDIGSKLSLLRELLRSCYGPTGRLKHIHNNIGGHVVTTSASSVLLAAITSSQPFINLIKSSILSHVSRFSDCGLFAAGFCLSLLERAQHSAVRKSVLIRANKHLLALCVNYLQQEDCSCKVKLDFCSSRNLLTLARSVLCSKPACGLTEVELLHISGLVVRAFLLTVPCSTPGTVSLGKTVTVAIEGQPVLDSAVFPGLLIEMPEDFCRDFGDSLVNPLRVVLFSTSLAGDLSEIGDGTIEVHPGTDTDLQILGQLLQVGKQMVKDGVKVFMCQKVVHPVLQQYLRSNSVLVIERLGINLMEPLIQLTGAQPLATFHISVPHTAYGLIQDLSMKQERDNVERVEGKMNVLLLSGGSLAQSGCCPPVLKVVSQKAEHVLRLALREPLALFGGGCTETHLAAYIRNESKSGSSMTSSVWGGSPTEYLLAVDVFCRSLESMARSLVHDGGSSLMDLTHAHHWTLAADVSDDADSVTGSCGCGMVRGLPGKVCNLNTEYEAFCPQPVKGDANVQPVVLDSFTAKVSALQVAVETANLALDVRYIIQDMN